MPLLGGFLLICVNYRLRYLLLPAGGEKFFLACGVFGAVGLLVSAIVAHGLKLLFAQCPTPYIHDLHNVWHHWIPYSLAQVLALLGLPLAGRLFNSKWDRATAYSLAMAETGDTLEVFFEEAIQANKFVLLSLHSGRVYVGKIEDSIKPLTGRRHIKLVPFMSGFRWPLKTTPSDDRRPNRIEWTTFYKETVRAVLSVGRTEKRQEALKIKIPGPLNIPVEVDARDMGVIVLVEDIESATRFNQRVFAYLNRDRYPLLEKTIPKDSAPDQDGGNLPASSEGN